MSAPRSAAMLCWGKKVSKPFRVRLLKVAAKLETNPDYLMACMAFESARTFSASITNAAGSGAVGLIQFMPSTAQALGTTTAQLAAMSAVKQLGYVEKYFLPRKGKLKSLADVYMAILWPAAVGKAEDFVLFDKSDPLHPKRYIQNSGLDFNEDGLITKGEATARVQRQLELGLLEANAST
ncbi:MAG: transglycosylase SLT domain-containing protein [Usitatibacter sp.]